MIVWQHDRTHDHSGTEDCSSVLITTAIGERYPVGTYLCDILDDMFERLLQIDADYVHGFSVLGLDAFIAPYAPMGNLSGVFGLDSWIQTESTETFGLDAELVSPTPVEIEGEFGAGAYITQQDSPVGQLVNPIDDDDTVIVITNPDDFPDTCPYIIQIDDEQMEVVGGCGTDTLTVIRGDNATAHPAGSVLVVC